MTLVRRFLVLCGLLFWQGGFTFYAAVVIPVGRQVLGSLREQAPITRQATWVLNLAGAAALLLLGWDLLTGRDPSARRRWARWLLWLGLLASLLALAWLHALLDRLFDPRLRTVSDPHDFSVEHQLYVAVSLLQCLLALASLGAGLAAWSGEDRQTEKD
jgi:hypothetical protein